MTNMLTVVATDWWVYWHLSRFSAFCTFSIVNMWKERVLCSLHSCRWGVGSLTSFWIGAYVTGWPQTEGQVCFSGQRRKRWGRGEGGALKDPGKVSFLFPERKPVSTPKQQWGESPNQEKWQTHRRGRSREMRARVILVPWDADT